MKSTTHFFTVAMVTIFNCAVFAAPTDVITEVRTETENVKSLKNKLVIGLEPAWLTRNGIGLNGEYVIDKNQSVGLSGVVVPEHDAEPALKSSGVDFQSQYRELSLYSRMMLTGDLKTNGIYVSPNVGIRYAAITNYGPENRSNSLTTTQIGTGAGYQWAIKNVRLSAGGQFRLIGVDQIVIRDNTGKVVHRQNSDDIGKSSSLDFGVSYFF